MFGCWNWIICKLGIRGSIGAPFTILCFINFAFDFSVDDLDGEKYFEIQSTDLMDGSIKMTDSKGKVIASARKERFGPGKMANIIVKNGESLYV